MFQIYICVLFNNYDVVKDRFCNALRNTILNYNLFDQKKCE